MNGYSKETDRIANSSLFPTLVEKDSTYKIAATSKHNGNSSYEFYRSTTDDSDHNFNEGTRRLLGAKDQEEEQASHLQLQQEDHHPVSTSPGDNNTHYLVNQSSVELLNTESGTLFSKQDSSVIDDKSHHFGGSSLPENFSNITSASSNSSSSISTIATNVTDYLGADTMGWNTPYKQNTNNNGNNIISNPSFLSLSTASESRNLDNSTTDISLSANNLPETNSNNNSIWDYYDLKNISFVPGGLFPDENGNFSSLCDLNFSICYNFTSNVTVQPLNDSSNDYGPTVINHSYWKLFLLIFPFLTVFGNILVCLSVYKERSLRTVTNYFIVSLAVADIMVAVFVMPLAVYVEVNVGIWTIGNVFCDTWVALDVMCCTASILNLTAISVDRFIAVTRPLSYAKHKGSNRVYVMLALVWLVSIGISSPIALGMNYTTRRRPELCTFYNADFIIYSSMGSFYIPCVIMMFLYWRIFKAIRDRARKSVAKRPKNTDHNSYKNVIENKAQTTRTSSEASNTEENGNGNGTSHNKLDKREMTQVADVPTSTFLKKPNLSHKPPGNSIETSFTNYNAKFSGTDTENENNQQCFCQIEAVKSPTSEDTENDHVPDHIIANQKLLLSPTSEEDTKSESNLPRDEEHSGYSAPSCVEVDVSNKILSPTYSNKALLSPLPHRKTFGLYKEYNPNKKKKSPTKKTEQHQNGTPKKYVTKFNFHLRHSKKKKKEKRSCSSRRERKATKTLAIVLGVFLLCWMPFFTINIMNAICIRYDLFNTRQICNINDNLFSLFVWLGYINSFLNPVIYTIFNIEFRKAFKKLLKHPCK